MPDVNIDREALSFIVPPLTTLVGVWMGWKLNRSSAIEAAREERQHASEQLVRQRMEEAASQLDAALVDAYADAPKGTVDAREAPNLLQPLQTQLWAAWTRTTVLDDPEISRRFHALNMTIGMATRARNFRLPVGEAQSVNLWPIEVGYRELREALAAYQIRKQPPAAQFPTAKELIKIVHAEHRNNFEAINDWLVENEVA